MIQERQNILNVKIQAEQLNFSHADNTCPPQ